MTSTKPVAVITGATRGIGRNMAVYFAERGYTVVGTGRDKQKLAELEERLQALSSGSKCYRLDVQDSESVHQTVKDIRSNIGKVHVWVNNAGSFAAIGPTWEVDPKQWENDVLTNLFGTFHCIQAVVPEMIEQGYGRIINVVGGGTISEFKYGNGYGTSKTAIARLTENLDAELLGTGVKAFAMDPGLNDTDMTKYQRETEAGQKYLPRITQMFEDKRDVPSHWAPELAYHLAEGTLDPYHGRVLSVYEDAATLVKKAEQLQDGDYYKLRLAKLDGTRRN
ncbi:SDR family oxidoreductase [Paenibacillus cremeus]|uniref:SDR family oxidoreductase n=1 Tax=Paenibacillus cremeus TaxID=2163881 RepID=A0A559JDF8_9BACL|nr:SDR family oxidoreductase [Paenibacillus cremeus]TVX97910.1 SDR family oxidoreductase [Paenibacillus cremeus]